MPDIKYPYMPADRHLKYVPADHPFMREAAKAREELAGDPLWPVGIVAVRDGKVVARAGNGFNQGHQGEHICPRIMKGCKTGEGYELCALHDPPGHSEPQLVKACREAGIETQGLDAYMYGHWWACEPCWKSLIDAGFRDLYVTDDAHDRFSKMNVYRETLKNYPEEIRKLNGV
jgi:deoxycytidylate deaminase